MAVERMYTSVILMVAVLASASISLSSSAAVVRHTLNNQSCRTITNPDSAKLIDLNVLKSGGATESLDYTVTSGKFPEYEYVFNVCGKLGYSDVVCADGSTICDRDSNTLDTVSVYGNDEDVVLDYGKYSQNETQTVLTLEYTAGQCHYRPQKNTIAKIFFFCDAAAYDPEITLTYEDYLECEVQINFVTIAACGTDKLKFSCAENGACVAAADGKLTHEECKTQCKAPEPTPPPPPSPAPPPSPPDSRYSCDPGVNPGMCFEAPAGEYANVESCESSCKYIPHTYDCKEGQGCVLAENGKFKSEAECLNTCEGPPKVKYACKDDACVEDELGKFSSKEMCEANCKPPDDSYKCEEVGGKEECVQAPGGVPKATCELACDTSSNRKAGLLFPLEE